ncbi:SAM domain-containing protein SAMSN-1b isoform X2 [Hippoglossus stenolepis]|uniref:SAM domain-containing protein SAMSN-1b isoform X2 n=1 Tax=Hippoglossus stenolepis TaxID=195615 RepID=UPI001FB02AF9|nr:SAM domain-containing protein SAMSN-1b isoform X2 [Hippoglossus stenolepis]
MNLFCFTLAGSTESLYEPASSPTLREVLPKYQCSPALLRCKPEWGGSEPSITSSQPENAVKLKRSSKRSCLPSSPLDNKTTEKDIHHVCWTSSGDEMDLSNQNKVRSREMCEARCQSSRTTRDDRVKELKCDRTQADLSAQAGETAADTAESIHSKRRQKKLLSLVLAKKGHQRGGKNTSGNNDCLADVLSNNNPVLTCIGLGKRTEKSSKPAASAQRQQAKEHEDSEEEGILSPRVGTHLWSPFECPQPWTPFYHTCQQPRHELWVCGGTLSLPRTTEWDRFETLIQKLDVKQPSPSPPQMIRSITDLHLSQNAMTRFGRFDASSQRSPLMKPQDDGSCAVRQPTSSICQQQGQKEEPTKSKLQEEKMEASPQTDRKHVDAPPKRVLTAITNGDTKKDEAMKKAAGGRPFTKRHRQSTHSLTSLYSLNSGQSSSSGVTSGSNCSSNRGSLRLEEDLLCTRQFCGRARVHTDHVPSPYDTESLKLKVGDVIDIITKPPMGIWKGMLNGKVGYFKFIYVDVLREERPEQHKETQTPKDRHRSTVQEVLKRLSLEQSGYQTVEDLMRLREHHLTELNVTDPEHRRRLLAAVDSLQQLSSDRQMENEANQEAETPGKSTKADMNNCSRDSGCPDNTAEDTELHSPPQQPLPAEMTAS